MLAAIGAPDAQGNSWILDHSGLDVEILVYDALAQIRVTNLLIATEMGSWPDGFEWRTPEIEQRLLNGESVPIGEIPGFAMETDDPLGDATLPYMKLRPGSPVYNPTLGSGKCTLNFVFKHVDQERWAIGSAGHCLKVLDEIQETELVFDDVDPGGVPFPLGECVLQRIQFGRTIMTTGVVRPAGGSENDFGLIEVFANMTHLLHPAIAAIDGPCGWRKTTFPEEMDFVQYYTHNPASGHRGQPRTGWVFENNYESRLAYHQLPGGGWYDSGTPVRFGLAQALHGLEAAAVNTIDGESQFTFYLSLKGPGPAMSHIIDILAGHFPDSTSWINDEAAGRLELVNSPNCAEVMS